MDRSEFLKINQAAWDRVAGQFVGGTALPEYGPLSLSESNLHLIDDLEGGAALELGFGSGHSLEYLRRHRDAGELWGVDFSPEQHRIAEEYLKSQNVTAKLLLGSMDENPGVPNRHFSLVTAIYSLGWTPDLNRTLELVCSYLKTGGVFVYSWEHPAYHCLEYNKDLDRYIFAQPYLEDKVDDEPAWKGVRAIVPHPSISDFVNATASAGLAIERMIESPVNMAIAKERQFGPDRWYSVPRARLIPTTLIVKARKRK